MILEDMYGKIMSINDSIILKYYKLAVFNDREKINGNHYLRMILNIKRSLAI